MLFCQPLVVPASGGPCLAVRPSCPAFSPSSPLDGQPYKASDTSSISRSLLRFWSSCDEHLDGWRRRRTISMHSLPVELLRIMFEYCDVSSMKALRLVSRTLASIGYEYLLSPNFIAVSWKDDIRRLHSISSHPQLRHSIESITFNFSNVDEHSARHTSFFQQFIQEPEKRNAILQEAWIKFYEQEALTRSFPPFHTQASVVAESLMNLPKLKDLNVTYTRCPYEIDVLKEVFQFPNCRKRDRAQACKNMNAIVSAIRHVQISSLTIDQLPLEIFRTSNDRKNWFACAPSFSSLTKLNLILDSQVDMLPRARLRAVNGLGHVLRHSPNLSHLTLGFHTYHSPKTKFCLDFRHLLDEETTFEKLTDLKLEGISTTKEDLRAFLVRHRSTLERVRLGGRGLAKPLEPSLGGVHLHSGTFRSLFMFLQGKLPKLQRFHLEGDFEAGDIQTRSREVYNFHAVTDDEWNEVAPTARLLHRSVNCLELENYMLHGGEFPRFRMPAT